MNMIAEAISNIPEPEIEPKDSFMKDGLWHCSKCGTPKQMHLNIFNTQKIVYIMCDCEKQASEDEMLKFRTTMNNEEIERSRKMALKDPEFRNHNFANDDGSVPKMKECRMYATDFENNLKRGSGILMYGPCGTGKSYAAEAIANRLIDNGFPVMITNFGKIAEAIMASTFEERGYFYSSLTKYPLIVIDDLGVERETEFMMEVMNRVIDERVRSAKPMIITTNFTSEEMKNPRSDDWARIFSRITSCCYPMKFEGDDKRKVKASKNYKEMNKYFNTPQSENVGVFTGV